MPPHFFGPCPKKREWRPKEKRLIMGGVYLKYRLTSSMEKQDSISSRSLTESGETPPAFGYDIRAGMEPRPYGYAGGTTPDQP